MKTRFGRYLGLTALGVAAMLWLASMPVQGGGKKPPTLKGTLVKVDVDNDTVKGIDLTLGGVVKDKDKAEGKTLHFVVTQGTKFIMMDGDKKVEFDHKKVVSDAKAREAFIDSAKDAAKAPSVSITALGKTALTVTLTGKESGKTTEVKDKK